ncbi:2'-5' RNA ligase family protein [Phenylobacterium sp.]|uniref:2'-5' RNA ligase family protein n=1 Tax=Phenylobacterium sp. TaxID=1871053 RepID=UPI0025DED505|nr:2'-5' RNA ligase family protein [Phenylobacterium sp.]
MAPGEHVLYFALRPSPEAARAALALGGRLCAARGLKAPLTPADRLHVSLNCVGVFHRVPEEVVDGARRAAEAVRGRRFTVAFNRLAGWGRGPGPRPVVLAGDEGVIGVEALHAAIHARLAAFGMVRGRLRQFWPHMTLLWDQAPVPETMVAPISWRVADFVLVDAFHGSGRRRILGAWPLSG